MDDMMHNSCLYVNIDQLRSNVYTILRDQRNGGEVIPVLKDNAYGLGLERIGQELADIPEIRTIGVAQVSEGVALRRAGVKQDILVLGGQPSHLLPLAVDEELTLSVGRLGLLPRLGQLARERGKRVRVQIKLETGLHRTGVAPGQEVDRLLEEWRRVRMNIQVTGAFTHFAHLGDAARTERQFQCYQAGVAQLEQGGMDIPLRHVSASEGSEYTPQYQLDGIRVGRRLYMDHPTRPLGSIQEVCSWRTWVTNIRALKAGDDLGYGGHLRLERDGVVATICVGYGDGLSVDLVQAGGPVLVRGQKARLLVCCMDQTLIDVTGIDCQVDDEVTLFGYDRQGNFLSAQEVSLLIGDYEGCGLTSQLSHRVARCYETSNPMKRPVEEPG